MDGGAPAGGPPTPVAGAGGLPENTAAALCYLLGLITGIIFLVLEPYSKNKLIRFHAFQSIFLNLAWIIVGWALGLLFAWRLITIVEIAFLVLWVYMLIQTYQGKKVMLPVIGDLAAKQAA
jgi:uncharacterized membrane protein